MADILKEFREFLMETSMNIRDKFNKCIPEGGTIDLFAYKLDNGISIRIYMRDRENVYFSYVINDKQFRDETEAMQKIGDDIRKGGAR